MSTAQTDVRLMPNKKGAALRLLLVEDNPDDAELLDLRLRQSGLVFSCRRVETEDAFRLELSRFEPDLILSDYTMPRFDGLSALNIAKRLLPKVPFVFLSGTIGEERAVEALKNGASDYVLKDRPLRIIPAIQRALQEAEELAALARMQRLRTVFGQLVTPEVAEFMLTYPEGAFAREEQKVMTVLFADMRQFTRYASHTDPTEVVRALNQIFECIAASIHAEHGILSKFLGDGVMALFGAPVPQHDHARAAARSAVRIREGIRKLTRDRLERGLEPFSVGIGINTGEVVAGVVGTSERMEYTVIGHAVNLAARLEEAAGPGEILVGAATGVRLDDSFSLRQKTALRLAGIDSPVSPYELVGLRSNIQQAL